MSWRTVQNLAQLAFGESGIYQGKPYACLGSGRYWDFQQGIALNQRTVGASVGSVKNPFSGGGVSITGKSGVLHVSDNTLLGNASTDEVPEGDNLYYTENRAISAGYYATAVGTDAYAITTGMSLAALVVGMRFRVLLDVANTGAATLAVDALPNPAAAILKLHDQALITGDLEAGQIIEVVWDGTNWQMISQLAIFDHGMLAGLADDDHTQYALLAGRAGGQSLSGGNAANDDLTLQGTTHATRTTSYVLLNPNGGNVGLGLSTPTTAFDMVGAHVSGVGMARFKGSAQFGFFTLDTTTVTGAETGFLLSIAGTLYGQFGARQSDGVVYIKNRLYGTGDVISIRNNGNTGFLTTVPTARVHLPAGEAGAQKGPLKLTPAGAVLVTAPEAGLLEVIGDLLHYTIPTGPTRKTVAFLENLDYIDGSLGAVDGAIPRADGVGGKTLQTSNVLIDDDDNISGARSIHMKPGGLTTYDFLFGGRLVAGLSIAWMRPYTNNQPMVWDIWPKGAPTDFTSNTGVAWQDICSTDIDADSVNYEVLRLGILSGGNAHVSHAAGGTGTIRDLILQLNGGNVGIGKAPTCDLDMDGEVRFGYNTDQVGYIGRAALGFATGLSDFAYFGHVDQIGVTTYGLIQSAGGATLVNSATGQSLHLRINNATKFIVTPRGNAGLYDGEVATANDGRVLGFGNNTNKPTLVAGIAAIYNKGGELYAQDSGAVETLLSEHANDAPEWFYDNPGGIPDRVSREQFDEQRIIRWTNRTRLDALMQRVINVEELPGVPQLRQTTYTESFDDYKARNAPALPAQGITSGDPDPTANLSEVKPAPRHIYKDEKSPFEQVPCIRTG